MRGALVGEPQGAITIADDLQVGSPGPGEALVAIEAAGVCGSDIAVHTGRMSYPMPVVLGHEAAGRVVALGAEDETLAVGDRVVLWMRPPCRRCGMCVRGEAALCERSGVMSARGTLPDGRTELSRNGQTVYRAFGIGAFVEQVVMPVAGLVPVPDDVPTEVAALMSCGVATGAGAVLNVARPSAGDVVVVLGGGGVGQAAAMAAGATGAAAVIVVDPVAERREQSLRLGATHAIEGGDRKAVRAQLTEAIGDIPVDVAIEAVGRPELVELGHRIVRQGGTVVAVGVQASDATVKIPGQLLALSHKRLLGCFMGGIDPQRDLPRLFALYRRGALPVDRLITATRPLEEAAEAVADLAASRGMRTVLDLSTHPT